MKKTVAALGLGASSFLVGGSAFAQSTAVGSIEETIVTARRIEENIQQTPVAIAAFTNQALEAAAVTELPDLTRIAPGMRFQGQGNIGNTEITVRGVNRVATGSGDPVTVTYFADVPLLGTSFLPTFDLANVQVLRGPQGTLFGVSTIGGAVLVNPTRPSHNSEGYLKATAGNEEYFQLEGASNIPVVADKLALRVAAQIRRRDGFVENIGVGGDFNDIHSNAYRASLLFEPNAALSNILIFDYIKNDETGWATIGYQLNPTSPLLSPFNPAAPLVRASAEQALALGPRKTNSNAANPLYDRRSWGAYNTTEWEISDAVTLKNIASYRDEKQKFVINADGVGLALFESGQLAGKETVTEELQFFGSAFDERLDWLVGGFYANTITTFSSLTPAGMRISNEPREDDNKAIFTNLGFALTDSVTLNMGYRRTELEQERCVNPVFPVNTGYSLSACKRYAASSSPTDGFGIVPAETTGETWMVGLDYQFSPDIFLYATARRGFRFAGTSGNFEHPCLSGGAAPPCSVDIGVALGGAPAGVAIDMSSFQNLDDEKISDFELGIRSSWQLFGWSQRLNLTAFRYVHENIVGQLNLLGLYDPALGGAPFGGTVGYNSGEVTARGVEFDLVLSPTDNLSLLFNGAYVDQEQTEDGVAPAGFPVAVSPATLAAPRLAGTAAIRYVAPFRPFDGELVFNFDYFHTDDWSTQGEVVPGYELSNMRIELNEIAGSGIDAGFWVRNVFDEEYLASPTALVNFLPLRTGNMGDPRMWGVDLRYRW